MDGLLKFGLVCAGGSLVCFVLAGDGGLIAIWFAVALLLCPLIVIKLRRNAAVTETSAPTVRNRHRDYVFASESNATPRRRRKVVQ